VIIFGTSGGGKTSLLNIIGTIDKPTKGEIKICGTLIQPKTSDDVLADIRLSKLGFVFQTFNLISSMSAVENVELPMTLKGLNSASIRRQLAIGNYRHLRLISF
jgi:putative ABC transport system ATP-binding protein